MDRPLFNSRSFNLKVCVIIVTYNRSLLLERSLAYLRDQSDRDFEVLVVDNYSDSDTENILSVFQGSLNIHLLKLPENTGPAGGFAEGLNWVLSRGYTHAILMEDEILMLDPKGIAIFKSCVEENVILFPCVIGKDNVRIEYPAWYSVLIPMAIVAKAGLPKKEYFFWCEDSEYIQYRLCKVFGLKIKKVGVKVMHYRADSKFQPAWKYYYKARNIFHFRVYVQTNSLWTRYRRILRTYVILFFKILFKENSKASKFRMLFLGIIHGIRGKLGKLVDPDKLL